MTRQYLLSIVRFKKNIHIFNKSSWFLGRGKEKQNKTKDIVNLGQICQTTPSSINHLRFA
jgi:hypothetical protein